MRNKKLEILESTIVQDQEAVANQWTDTFLYNPADDVAIQMTQLLVACVAAGDFKTRAYLSKSPELKEPDNELTVIDYLSHASRIILDYQKLTDPNRNELLKYFPKPEVSTAVGARSATHAVTRVGDSVVESKGVYYGLIGQLPAAVNAPRDFGVNIGMGGDGKINFYGKKISSNGYSGHFYFHRNDADNLLLLGLEQSAPSTARQLFLGAPVYAEGIQQGHDQFGQGHSLKGASDTYTAAGSLYFSDPIYQAKLLLEKGCFPPDKYGAMQVTITDESWLKIKQFLDGLKQAVATNSRPALLAQLKQKPCTAKPVEKDSVSYIALDFDSYLKQIFSFITDSHLEDTERELIKKRQLELLNTIKQLQNGDVSKYDTFLIQIEALSQVKIPAYAQAINRIKGLFELQREIDPNLNQTHEGLLLERQYDELKIESHQLSGQLQEVKQYYQAISIEKDLSAEIYIQQLDSCITKLRNPCSPGVEENKDNLFDSWTKVDAQLSLTLGFLDGLKRCVDEAKILLLKAPKLYSETVVEELQTKLKEEAKQKKLLNTQLEEKQKTFDRLFEEKTSLLLAVMKVEENLAVKEQQEERAAKEQQENRAAKEQQEERTFTQMIMIAPVLKNISKIKEQIRDFDPKTVTYAQATTLVGELEAAVKVFTKDEKPGALSRFDTTCQTVLEKPRDALYEHGEFKRIVEKMKPRSATNGFPTMEVIGGFIAVLGAAAVAVALTVLTITTFGAGALATVGIGAALLGLGLFAAGTIKRCQSKSFKEPEYELV